MTRTEFMHKLRQVFAPSDFKCLSCGAELFEQTAFCAECMKDVSFNNGKTCKRCGVAIDGEEDYCGNCAFDKTYFDRAYSVFNYDGNVRKAILQMKFANLGSIAHGFAPYLAFLSVKQNLQYDLVTFAPMSAKSRKVRHYNQAQLLAAEFCDILGVQKLLTETVVKIRETPAQEKLSRSERKTNLVGCYRIKPDVNVKGKHILLIDDVKTTGATINECAKVLKRAGAARVEALTVASRKEDFNYENEQE